MTKFKGESKVLDSDDAKYFAANSEFLIKKYAAFYNNLIDSLSSPVGTLKKSVLSEADYQFNYGADWVLMNGQDVTGSQYEQLTGESSVPDMTGEYQHVSQVDNEVNILQESPYGVEAHRHLLVGEDIGGTDTNESSGPAAINKTLFGEITNFSEDRYGGVNSPEPSLGTTQPQSQQPSIPNTVKANYFVRINQPSFSDLEFIQSEELRANEEFGEQLLKMAIGLNEIASLSPWKLGDIRQSIDTEGEFQARAGDNWVLLKGQDITSSDLNAGFGIDTLPDVVADKRFFAQAEPLESIFDFIESQNGDHSHRTLSNANANGTVQGGRAFLSRNAAQGGERHANANLGNIWNYRSGYDGDINEQSGHSTCLRVNFFIKINEEASNF